MSFEINYLSSDRAITPAFSYDSESKVLVPLSSRVTFEQGIGEFAITVNGDYPLVYDAEGLLVGDLTAGQRVNQFPRLDFIQIGHQQIRQRIASLTQNGFLISAGVAESSVLPEDSLNLMDLVAFNQNGITATNVNEVWFLSDNGNYVCTNGQLIRVRL